MRLCKMLLTVVGATVLFGALVGTASARTLTYSEARLTSNFARVEFSGASGTTRCNVTLAGVLHSRTLGKVLESLVGLITEARVGGCDAGTGSATILTATLPWHIRYNGFGGTLPNISQLRTKVIGSAFRVREPNGLECLVTSTAAQPTNGNYTVSGGVITAAEMEGSFSCFFITARLRGNTTDVRPVTTVRLI